MTTSTPLSSPLTALRSRLGSRQRSAPAARPTPHDGSTASPRRPTRPPLSRLWRGPEGDPSWARPALLGLLALTLAAYLVNLTASGWANAFYSAAAQAGSQSWKAFFYGSSDAANAITVDKPPASLWAMALSVRVLGLSSFAILLPQVLMGVASVGVLYASVKRHFGPAAGLVAGASLALTPVAALMFRFDNPDALLVLLMTLGAWATTRAIDERRARWLVLAGVFLGFGFLTKTLQVFLVLPGFAAAYLIAADTTLVRRLRDLTLAGLAFVLAAGWWVAVVELVPASMRPYIGGSQDNSFLSLTFGYNGFGRLTGNETGSVGGGGGGRSPAGVGGGGTVGITRLLGSELGGQVSWLLPSALLLLVAGIAMRGRRPRVDGRRASYVVWGGWLLVTGLTFSWMAGIFHAYYTVALAPAIAALVGMGAVEAWERRDRLGRVTLAAATALAAAWGYVLLDRTSTFVPWLRWVVVILGLAAALMLLVVDRVHRRAVPLVVAGALVAALAGPASYTAQTISTGHRGSIVTAGPSSGSMGGRPGGQGGQGGPAGQGGQGTAAKGTTAGGSTRGTAPAAPGGSAKAGATTGKAGTGSATRTGTQTGPGAGQAGGMGGLLDAQTPSTEVVSALTTNASHYTWVAAAIGSQNAAGLQLGTQRPVMAIGGFNGTDPSPTLAQFESYVAQGKIHYLLASQGMAGSSSTGGQILTWAKAHYKAVTIGGTTFYDLTSPLA